MSGSRYYQALQQAGAQGESTVFIVYMCQVILDAIASLPESDQVSDQVRALLDILPDKWLSTAEIMQLVGLSHRPSTPSIQCCWSTSFMKNYLVPAIKLNYIEMQYPDSPRSPKQKYRKVKRWA